MKRPGFTLIESLSVIAIFGILVAVGSLVITQSLRYSRDAKRKSDLYALASAFDARAADKTCSNQTQVGQYPGLTASNASLGSGLNWQPGTALFSDTSSNTGIGQDQLQPNTGSDQNSGGGTSTGTGGGTGGNGGGTGGGGTGGTPSNAYHWINVALLANDTGCAGFSAYLSKIPTEPKNLAPYYFNLSREDNGKAVDGTHYRLATQLEKTLSASELSDCQAASDSWTANFAGYAYDCVDGSAIVNGNATDQLPYNFYLGR